MLEHGGRLRAAARQWHIPLDRWIDLSTGIAPWPYPVSIAREAWLRLPEDEDELVAVAAARYGHPSPLPLPGSQSAIQWLPRLLDRGRVLLPRPSYSEYAPAWRAAGHAVDENAADVMAAATDANIIMLGNPNNPTATLIDRDRLLALAEGQARRGGWLIVDEAFADAGPAHSVAALAGTEFPRLIVLRSLGKFYGLAGARVGFLCAEPALRERMAEALGPWALAHPSRVAATQALDDGAWQAAQRLRLAEAGARLEGLLARHGLPSRDGGSLFRYAPTAHAGAIADHFARRGILLRVFRDPPALRVGLPGCDADWTRFEIALDEWSRS